MSFPFEFLLKITKTATQVEQRPGTTSISIQRPYAHIEEELRAVFQGQEGYKVVVDRRYGERRTTTKPAPGERRSADRRGTKQKLAEVIISPWTK